MVDKKEYNSLRMRKINNFNNDKNYNENYNQKYKNYDKKGNYYDNSRD